MSRKTNLKIRLFAVVTLIFIFGQIAFGQDIIYVDSFAAPGGDGTGWAQAYKYLQDALDDTIHHPKPMEIWVAEGKYYPDEGVGLVPGDPTAAFQLINGVTIYGGFPNVGEPDMNDRNPSTYETILSGDIGIKDDPNDNSYHVFYHPSGTNLDSNAIINGCTITCARANGSGDHWYGGGMYNDSSSPTVTNCTFRSNTAYASGGGMYNFFSRPTVTNCIFSGNFADAYGGGIFNAMFSCTITTNCTFSGNSADLGGGISNAFDSSPTVFNCTFSENCAVLAGCGMYSGYDCSPTMKNCILWDDTPDEIVDHDSSSVVTYSDVQGGWPGYGNINADPKFQDSDGDDDIIGTEDDNLRLSPDSPCIDEGVNTVVTEPDDLDGRDRIVDGDCNDTEIVDMGAYEFTSAYYGDFDGECDVDFVDYAILANYWLTDEFLLDIAPTPAGDGIVDEQDLAILCSNWLAGTEP